MFRWMLNHIHPTRYPALLLTIYQTYLLQGDQEQAICSHLRQRLHIHRV